MSCPVNPLDLSAARVVRGCVAPLGNAPWHCQGAQRSHGPRGERPAGGRVRVHCGVVPLGKMARYSRRSAPCLARGHGLSNARNLSDRTLVCCPVNPLHLSVPQVVRGEARRAGQCPLALPRGATQPRAAWGAPCGRSCPRPLRRCAAWQNGAIFPAERALPCPRARPLKSKEFIGQDTQ